MAADAGGGALAPLDETTLGALHPARALPAGLGDAEAALRLKYVGEKKVPQLRWVLHQLHGLMRARARAGARVRRVVDLGCGRADLSLLLARLHPHVRVLALDSNEAAVADARARAAAARLDNVRFACGARRGCCRRAAASTSWSRCTRAAG